MARSRYFSEKTQTSIKRLAIFFGTILLFWILSTFSWFASFVHTGEQILYGIASVIARTSTRIVASDESVMSQLGQCTAEKIEQTIRATNLASASDEIEQWRQLFRYTRENGVTGIAAGIIARGELASSDLIIDRGKNDGIQVGAAVIVSDGIFFGSIRSVRDTQSTVLLVENPKSAIAATILGQKKTLGLVTGNEGAVLTMQYIPQDAHISIGDSVITSGLGGKIPEGLILGTISTISTEESSPFVSATITPLQDPRTQNIVSVLPYVLQESL